MNTLQTFNQDSFVHAPNTKADFKENESARNRIVSRMLIACGLGWIPDTLAM